MSDKRQLTSGGTATARKPRVVLVGSVAGKMAETLRNLDCDVFTVSPGADLACTVLSRRPTVAVLPVETDYESGYLVAAKLRKAKSKLKVVLVAPKRTPEIERFARFVGASLVVEADVTNRLVSAVSG
jgi:hypothetical protein